jgi:hypothetical protein
MEILLEKVSTKKPHQLNNTLYFLNYSSISAYFWHIGQTTSAVCVDMESAAAHSMLSLNWRFSSYSRWLYWDSIAFSVEKNSGHRHKER